MELTDKTIVVVAVLITIPTIRAKVLIICILDVAGEVVLTAIDELWIKLPAGGEIKGT